VKHLRILLYFSLLSTANLVKLIFTFFAILILILALLAFAHLLVCFICSIGSTLFELSINVLDIGQHLDGDMSHNKVELCVMHVRDICPQRSPHV
jgi:hypothetical protein